MSRLGIHPAAEAELDHETTHYNAEEPRLGDRFSDEVFEMIEYIEQHPDAGFKLEDPHVELRRFVLKTFPFAIIVVRTDDLGYVLAIAPTSKKPEYWRDRLE